MRIAIVGFGAIAATHFEAISSLENAHLAAICDSDPAARARAQSCGIPSYPNLAAALAADQLDVVAICTPPDSHRSIAAEALAAGCAVLCEKPLGVDLADSRRILEAVSLCSGRFQMATKFRHVRDVAAAKLALDAGTIGQVATFSLEFSGRVAMGNRWNAKEEVSGGGVLIDNGYHAFDLLQHLLGPIEEVFATALMPLQAVDVEDSVLAVIRMKSGAYGQVLLSWSLTGGSRNYLMLRGERGRIELGWKDSRLVLDGAEPLILGSGYNKHASHLAMWNRFLAYSADRAEPWLSTGEMERAAMCVEAAYQSISTRSAVPIQSLAAMGPALTGVPA